MAADVLFCLIATSSPPQTIDQMVSFAAEYSYINLVDVLETTKLPFWNSPLIVLHCCTMRDTIRIHSQPDIFVLSLSAVTDVEHGLSPHGSRATAKLTAVKPFDPLRKDNCVLL